MDIEIVDLPIKHGGFFPVRYVIMCLPEAAGVQSPFSYVQWPFQEPKLKVPIPYIRPIFQA